MSVVAYARNARIVISSPPICHTPHVYQDSSVLIYIWQMAALPLAADEHAVRSAPRARLCGQLIATMAQDASAGRVKSTATQPSIIESRHMLPVNIPILCSRNELGLTLISHGCHAGPWQQEAMDRQLLIGHASLPEPPQLWFETK